MTENESNVSEAVSVNVDESLSHTSDFLSSFGASEKFDKAVKEELGVKHGVVSLEEATNVNSKNPAPAKLTDEKPVEEKPKAAAKEEKALENKEVNEDADSILNDLDINLAKPETKKTYSDLSELAKEAEKKFNIKNPATLISSAEKWRTDAQQVPVLQKELEQWKGAFQTLPEELQEVMIDFHDGKDWKSKAAEFAYSIDMNTEFDKQDLSKLVMQYYPDTNLSDDEASDFVDLNDKKDRTTKILIEAVKTQFELSRKDYIKRKDDLVKSQQLVADRVNKSVRSSVDGLIKSLPKADQKRIASVEKVMSSGDIESALFLTKEGTFNETAAERLYYAMHGKDIVEALIKKIKGQDATIEDVLGKGSENADVKKRNPNPNAPMADKDVDVASGYLSQNNDDTYGIKKKK